MSITRLPEIVFPLTQVNKVNEIVDVLNDNLNMYYSAQNPALTSVEGVCTWTVTHNLGTENVNCSLYNGDNLVISNVSITSDNVVTINFNSSVNIPADTYKIVIISNGAGSSSGSGSYVLPTASTTTLGGVRIDGSSITINNGVISSTVDSTLSSTSTNPVQNRVLYPSLNEFLPSGTIINVKTDGSGDFTTLEDALSYLVGKWSNGSVIVELSAGTFTTPDSITINSKSIPNLTIKGQGKTSTILQTARNTSNTDWIFIDNSKVFFQGLKFKSSTGTKDTSCRGINVSTGSLITLRNCAFDVLNPGVWVNGGGTCVIQGAVDFTNSTTALYCSCGVIRCTYGPSITLNNITTCFNVEAGGQIHFYNPSVSKTNVTNIANQEVGTATNNGWITGITA
jgi:hypothetical protein